MAHRAKKHLGQHFLNDQLIIEQIIRVIRVKETDKLVEIGPGQGALTTHLFEKNPNMACIEFDPDLIEFLTRRYPELKLFYQDALTFDFKEYAGDTPIRVVGNLPYNISTPIIFHLIEQLESIKDMYFMLQKEVVDRICAEPGSKKYGRLSVMVQYACQTFNLFDVPETAFTPPPKVQSAIVHLKPYTQDNFPYEPVDLEALKHVVTSAFSMRRKTLRNALKPLFDAEQLESMDLNLQARPETLSVSDFVYIAKQLGPTSKET